MRQIDLEHSENSNVKLVCWLDKITSKQIGHFLTIKGSREWWRVVAVGSKELPKKDVRKEWKVGGL